MTQRSCCVPSCLVKLGDGVLLHRFPNPSNPAQIERFRTWVMRIGGDIISKDNAFIYRNRRVCHRHFEDVYVFPSMKLSALAVPSLHIPGPKFYKSAVEELKASSTIETNMGFHEQDMLPTSSMPGATIPSNKGAVCSAPKSLTTEVLTVASEVGTTTRGLEPNMPSTSIETEVKIHSIRGCKNIHNQLTSSERQLKEIISDTKQKLRKSQSVRRKLKIQMEAAEKIMRSSGYKLLEEKLSPEARTFFHMQIKQHNKKPTGRRFTIDEKVLCLSLYKPSPKAYRLLSQFCILPKRKTLDKLLNSINLQPGINTTLFQHLKKRVEKLPMQHRYCTIIFDEMAISPNLFFDKTNDIIHGFTNDGYGSQKNFSDHVCVFMIRGIVKKYKQPVSFTFCRGSTKSADLVVMLKTVIKNVTDCGLKVVATVCDQGASNLAALNILMNHTKVEYLKANKNYSEGFFEVNGTKIYAVYDPPHLLKGIRNNLLNKDLEFKENNKIKRASWTHLEALYKRGPGYKGVKLVHKLTAQHVIPSLIPKMRVKHCSQVFSETVGVTMGYMAEIGRLPEGSADTADLLLFFDRLFDSVNGNFHKPEAGKVYRSAVTPRSLHHKLWYKCLPVLKSMKFVSKSGQKGTVPSLTSWIKTIEAFISLTKFLHSAGLKSILLRNINQDPLENFFGAIRSHGFRNIMPSAYAFINSYKSLLITNLTSAHSVGANCESDNLDLLQSLKYLLTETGPQQKETELKINNDHLCIMEANVDDLIKNPEKKEKCAAIAYCSGWIIHILKKTVYKSCQTCRNDLESDKIEPFHDFIKIKEYDKTKTWLCYPSRKVFDFFFNVEHIAYEILKSECNNKNICAYINIIVTTHMDLNFITCIEHRSHILDLIIKKTVVFFINNWCREVNQLLTGKTTFWDTADEIKVAAEEYHRKHIKRPNKK